jgi:hypothetical protein
MQIALREGEFDCMAGEAEGLNVLRIWPSMRHPDADLEFPAGPASVRECLSRQDRSRLQIRSPTP